MIRHKQSDSSAPCLFVLHTWYLVQYNIAYIHKHRILTKSPATSDFPCARIRKINDYPPPIFLPEVRTHLRWLFFVPGYLVSPRTNDVLVLYQVHTYIGKSRALTSLEPARNTPHATSMISPRVSTTDQRDVSLTVRLYCRSIIVIL